MAPLREPKAPRTRVPAWHVLAAALLLPVGAAAEAERDRFSAGGYFRVATRPDLQGGSSKLGYWNVSGRLLNEGPWAALELKLDILQPQPDAHRPWTSVHAKVEGGSLLTTDPARGALGEYRLTQLYALAGDVLLDRVTWQVGTLDTWLGDLGLYDMKPAQIFYETVGAAARYRGGVLDAMIGVGDSGWFLRGAAYDTIFTVGGLAKLKFGGFEVGAGGQLLHEPSIAGDRNAPYTTPGVRFEDYVRDVRTGSHEVVDTVAREKFGGIERIPDGAELFDRVRPSPATSGKAVGYIGFGGLGPLVWNSFYASLQLRHPDASITESYGGHTYTVYVKDLTDQRWQLLLGNEARFEIIPDWLDAAWGIVYGWNTDRDNTVASGDDNRTFYSTVLRLQGYPAETLHLLAETSLANEISDNGNLYRNHVDSIYASKGGAAEVRGLEFGDASRRTTWQLKVGPVINPTGLGIYARPSILLLYGLQYSTQNNAWGNGFVESLNQYNQFGNEERHWHHVLALEAEAWF